MFDSAYNKIMKYLPEFISPLEELLVFGGFLRKAGYLKNQLTFGYARLWNQGFTIAVTNKRVIVIPINRIAGM